jgi:hypothetical protein
VVRYELITFCGTAEHLTSLPRQWFAFLRPLLSASGFLLLETPNAAALKNRLLLLAGWQPYRCHDTPRHGDKGHIREWTRREIIEAAADSGLRLFAYRCVNDICHPGLAGRLYRLSQALLPAALRDDMYFIFTR